MAYTIPTPADVKAAFAPEFDGVGDVPIQTAIDMGGLVIDETWPENAFTLAYLNYAAHVLRVNGYGTVAGAGSAEQGGSNVKRKKAGDHEIEFFGGGENVSQGSAAWYALTPYGSQFYIMQRRYFGGPRVF